MSLQQSPTITAERPDMRNESETRLRGRWLFTARVGWIVLTLLILTLSAIALPREDALFQSICQPGVQCLSVQLAQADLRLLHQLGLSSGFLAAYQVGLDVGTLLIYSVLAALIFWRRSQDRMAIFCAYMLVLVGGATYTSLLSFSLRSMGPVWYWLVGMLDLIGQVSLLTFFLLFPTGRFVPRWTRWGVLVAVLLETHYVFLADLLHSQVGALDSLGFAVFVLGLVGLQIYRYRRVSTFRERQQTKWVVFGFSIAVGGFALSLIFGTLFVPQEAKNSVALSDLLGIVPYSLLILIPISIAIAILRSHLYEIDTLINRVLVYGLLTGLLAAVYVGLVIGLQTLLRGIISQDNGVAIVLSTLFIAALFQPLRHRLQKLIDRRFYRSKYDAAKTVAAFSTTLRQEVDLDQLREHLLTVVQETMQPTHVSLWLRPPEHDGTHRATWRATPPVSSEEE